MFGKRLNLLRKHLGYTAQFMADSLNIGLHSYRNYENGNRQPSFAILVQIADLLNVSTDYLLGRDVYLQSLGESADGR